MSDAVLDIDDKLIEQARALTGINEEADLLREGLKALIQRESPERLAQLERSEPSATYITRRQSTLN